MKKVTQATVSLLVLSAIVFAPALVSAQLEVGVNGKQNGSLNVTDGALNTNISTSSSVNSTSGVKSESTTNTKANLDINIGGGYNSESPQESSDSDSNSQVTTTNSINSQGSLKVNALGVAVISASQVNSDSDLEIFNSNIASKDKAIAEVNAKAKNNTESKVEVVYRHKGKLLGFMPVTVKSTTAVEAQADAEIKISSKMPWWSFLVANKNYAKTDLESRIRNNATVKANAKVDASAQSKAEIAEALITEIEANANASVNK